MPSELARRLASRDRGAVAEALNLIEDERPAQRQAAAALLSELEGLGTRALRVGITGAPGAGKSTLIDALVRDLRLGDRSVGIIAIDPSSKISGGALLGDRLRMRSAVGDPGVFLRSMAARDRLGGLSGASRAGVEILAAAFDVVLVETVGVGQSESEIVNLVHTLVFVAQPGAGDSVQFMKAGLIEMPDIFVVNKADLGPVAERTQSELLGGLGLGEAKANEWTPPVLLVSARDAQGVEAIAKAIIAHREYLEANDSLVARLDEGKTEWLQSALLERYGSYGIEALGGRKRVKEMLRAEKRQSLPDLLRQLSGAIEEKLRET
ncbi:MAG: methylmalonyl Co-A mutase-associated GTPase MeaB [Deltaproteobacteria bacterium]|nr:methylmalonyl Co-A mutase-associated GTPase MeaB [Deltaproteobacteria bacterium]